MFKLNRKRRQSKKLLNNDKFIASMFNLSDYVCDKSDSMAQQVNELAGNHDSAPSSFIPSRCSHIKDIFLDSSVPHQPMLARPVRDFNQLHHLLTANDGRLAVEEKLDGERLLCSLNGDTRRFYTRTLKRVPEENAPMLEFTVNAESCVLDGELVYIDERHKIVPICNTGTRANARKHYIVFDVQEINGENVMLQTYRRRRELLLKILTPSCNVYTNTVTECTTSDQIKTRFAEVVDDKRGEGLMLKPMNTGYMPDSRTGWWKLKSIHMRDHRDEYTLFAHRCVRDRNGLFNIIECGYYTELETPLDDPRALDSHFVNVCRVSSGVSAEIRASMTLRLDNSEESANVAFFNDFTIVDVSADMITARNKSLRHPIFVRFRDDLRSDDGALNDEIRATFDKI